MFKIPFLFMCGFIKHQPVQFAFDKHNLEFRQCFVLSIIYILGFNLLCYERGLSYTNTDFLRGTWYFGLLGLSVATFVHNDDIQNPQFVLGVSWLNKPFYLRPLKPIKPT